MTIRYMGTKRHMVDDVRSELVERAAGRRAVDLFSGMGSVVESLSDGGPSVVTNDAMEFTGAFARARFTGKRRADTPAKVALRLKKKYLTAFNDISAEFAEALGRERKALDGSQAELRIYMDRAQHVANTPGARRVAKKAREAVGDDHYRLASLYFSAGYLGLRQAIEVDALRAAIDSDEIQESRDWLLASWLAATSVLINAPGHTAQFLRPNSASAHNRIVATWRRSIWDEFVLAMDRTKQVGTSNWRASNECVIADALDLISGGRLQDVGVIYADPPYTKDQYSRFYHLYETLFRYDYPDANGAGRVRSDRFSTGFSLKSAVRASFHDLFRNVSRMNVPLVLSYPDAGLLEETGVTADQIARQYFSTVEIRKVGARHSTMGASSGESKKHATENLYVCTP